MAEPTLLAFILNFCSPTLIIDIILHPLDFGTVLLQVGYNPEGFRKRFNTGLSSALVKHALYSICVPYVTHASQGKQPGIRVQSPGVFYYVNYIYKVDGLFGCYRAVGAKICERFTMFHTMKTSRPEDTAMEKFVTLLINSVCCHFFAVIASHPFHVAMVRSFGEFIENSSHRSTMSEVFTRLIQSDGYFGLFIGLGPRLVGEILALSFCITYTTLAKLLAAQSLTRGSHLSPVPSHLVQYLTMLAVSEPNTNAAPQHRQPSHNRQRRMTRADVYHRFLTHIPIMTSAFYYTMIRDYIAKKISYPFFLVCHSMIILDTGWEQLPWFNYCKPFATTVHSLVPRRKND